MAEMSMMEKVARAIHAKRRAPDDNKHWFHENHECCELSRQLARAAVEAMREPTEAMGRLVREKHGFSDASMYRGFIDAALNGKEG